MEGGFFEDLRQLEFFPGAQDEKRGDGCSISAVVSTAPPAQLAPADHGLYQNEESVDFSSIIEAYNAATVTGSPVQAPQQQQQQPPVSSSTIASISPLGGSGNSPGQEVNVTANSNFHIFSSAGGPGGYPDLASLTHPSMYGTDGGYHAASMQQQQQQQQQQQHHIDMTPSPPSMAVDCIGVPATPSPHVVQIDNGFTALRPAPGKERVQKNGKKKNSLDRNSMEYRLKRDRNNIAVRKSREKSKIRVMDTEKRVRELEEENTHLQSKIALLSKELNVLKSLFTSAGVSQPPSFHVKGEQRAQT